MTTPAATKTIGIRQFIFAMLPARKAVRVQVEIARVIGEPLFRAFMDPRKTGMSEEAQAEAVGAAIGMLTAKMDAGKLEEVQEIVFGSVSCNGVPINSGDTIDAIFAGLPDELWIVFMEALKVNFSRFLLVLRSRLQEVIKPTSSPSDPPTSTGTSSDLPAPNLP